MTAAERLKKIEGEIAELNIRMSGVGGGGGANHNLLSATHPDTDPDSPVRGDILRGIAGPEWQRYAIGAAGRFLRSDGVDPAWDTIQAADLPAHAAEHEVGGGDLVDHDNLTNYVANEHIDHTAITLTAGEGLTGGGTIAVNRSFALDINGLVEQIAASGDFFVYYDTTAGDHKKIDWDDLPGGGGGASTFLGLTDTPAAYGDAGKVPVINKDEDALEFKSLCWVLEIDEDFNDLVDGSISGKGGYINWGTWVEDNGGTATTEVVDLGGGNKILRLTRDGGGEAKCYLDFNGNGNFGLRSGFVIKAKIRMNANNSGRGQCWVYSGGVAKFAPFYMNDDGDIKFWDGATKDYGTYVADTWYEVFAIFLPSYGTYLGFTGFLDGDYATGDTSAGNSNVNLDRILFECLDDNGREFDIDYIKIWRFNPD